MVHNHLKFSYGKPMAAEIEKSGQFVKWLVKRTEFSHHSEFAIPLFRQQMNKRTEDTTSWWRDYWTGTDNCSCQSCGGKPTEMLVIFDGIDDFRFALHFEINASGKPLPPGRAADYRNRANCWADRKPKPTTVLKHDAASTVLLAPQAYLESGDPEISQFETAISFEDIAAWIPQYPQTD